MVSARGTPDKASGSASSSLVRDVPPAGRFRFRDLDRPSRPWGLSIVGNVVGEPLIAAVVVVIVDIVDQGPDSQAPRIGRAALLSAPLRELRAGGSWATAAPMMGFIMGCTCFKGTTLSHLFQGWYCLCPLVTRITELQKSLLFQWLHDVYVYVCVCIYVHTIWMEIDEASVEIEILLYCTL